MNWEKLIISPKSSKLVKEKLSILNNININKTEKSEVKYIGVIPIYWDTLGIYYKNKKEQQQRTKIEEDFQKMDLSDDTDNNIDIEIDIDINTNIKNIYTKRSQIIVQREFYYLETNSNDKINSIESYYPVFKFSNDLSFTLREIKNQIRIWLLEQGFRIDIDSNISEFDIFRIYKMNGFHIFSVILSNKTDVKKLKGYWKSNHSLELLPLINNEIINPFMKISQLKHYNNSNSNINYGNISSIWLKIFQGYLLNESENLSENNNLNLNIIPYKIKYDEMLATLANLIDLECNENLHLYFIPRIQEIEKLKIDFRKK